MLSFSEIDKLPPVRLFEFHYAQRNFAFCQSNNSELSLWDDCIYERSFKTGDVVVCYVDSSESVVNQIFTSIKLRNKNIRIFSTKSRYSLPPLKRYFYFNASQLDSCVKIESDSCIVADISNCSTIDTCLNFPNARELRIMMKEGCITSDTSSCIVPKIHFSTGRHLRSPHLYFSGCKLPVLKSDSWEFASQKLNWKKLHITNTKYSTENPTATSCEHNMDSNGNAVACWDEDDKEAFKVLTSKMASLMFYGLGDEIMSLVSWNRVRKLYWTRLAPSHQCALKDGPPGEESTTDNAHVIIAEKLYEVYITGLIKESDTLPCFGAPGLETVVLTAIEGSDTVWDFDHVFQSYEYMNKIKKLSISHQSGLELEMKEFRVPQSVESLTILGCHAPWLFVEPSHGLVLENLTELSIDLSQVSPSKRHTDTCYIRKWISFDLRNKYPKLKQLRLMAQLGVSYNFEGHDGQGIVLDLSTAPTLQSLRISPAIELNVLLVNGRCLPLGTNPCPNIPYYLRKWDKLDQKGLAEASVERYIQGTYEQTKDTW